VSGLRVDEARLDNGLRVVGEHNPAAASVAIGVVLETGSRDERPDEHGVSHFLEHLCFKGDEARSGADVSRELDALGARYNAYTSEERTVYYGAVLPEAGPRLLGLLCDMMRPALRSEDVELERHVVLEEIAMYADRPDALVFERGARSYYGDHPYGRGVLGTEVSLRGLDAAAVRAYWERRYTPANQVVVLTGRYDWDAALRQLAAATRGWDGVAPGRVRAAPPLNAGRANASKASLTRAHAALFAPGVGRADPRRTSASLLAHAIGDDDNGVLFWALVEPGHADSASLWHDPADGFGTFQGYVGCAPTDLERVLAVVETELARVQDEGVAADAWRQAQRSLATGLTLRGETPMGRLISVASSYLDRGRVLSVAEVVDEVLHVPLSEGERLLAVRPFDGRLTFTLEPAAELVGTSA
jgi:predicted Zn-dependent peptidase